MLVGVTLILIGEALAFGSLGISVYALAFFSGGNVLMLALEEPSLLRRFSSVYEAYRREVPRRLPRLRQRSR